MIRDITIGQYYPAKSVIHRMDPNQVIWNANLHYFRIPVPQRGRICRCNVIPGRDDHDLSGSGEVYL